MYVLIGFLFVSQNGLECFRETKSLWCK